MKEHNDPTKTIELVILLFGVTYMLWWIFRHVL